MFPISPSLSTLSPIPSRIVPSRCCLKDLILHLCYLQWFTTDDLSSIHLSSSSCLYMLTISLFFSFSVYLKATEIINFCDMRPSGPHHLNPSISSLLIIACFFPCIIFLLLMFSLILHILLTSQKLLVSQLLIISLFVLSDVVYIPMC